MIVFQTEGLAKTFPDILVCGMGWVNLGAKEEQQGVWALTEKGQMTYGRRKTKDGAIVRIVEWEKYRGTIPCTPVVLPRECVVVPENRLYQHVIRATGGNVPPYSETYV